MESYDATRSVLILSIDIVFRTFEDDYDYDEEVSGEDFRISSLNLIEKFISALKEQVGGHLEDKVLISTLEGKNLYELKEGVKKFKTIADYECCILYVVLTKKIPSEELDGLFLDMDLYGFSATFPCFPDEENKLITQGYDEGEYNTGYFSNDKGPSYVEMLPNGSNSHFQMKEYNKAKEMLLK